MAASFWKGTPLIYMTELRKELFSIQSASMGQNNPIPNILSKEDQHAEAMIDSKTINKSESRYMGYARIATVHPYTIQDGYNRVKRAKRFESYVLENQYIKARFIPEFGGRLWSLFDKTTGKELLHVNPVFQPCNLALRNAWISGGVEWNIGIIGHTPYTLDRLFVRTKTLSDGTPVLSMYQYERVRRLLYRVEAFLPAESKHLFVRVRIDNPLDRDTAVYWWSNMAVNEKKDVRVLVPAHKAFHFHAGKLSKVNIPHYDDMDISYSTNINSSMDFFFDIPKEDRKYIAALNKDGYGMVQCSTSEQQGRKLFVWGQGRGGKNWQSYLSKKGSAYIEIQAGLAKTQLEHLPMGPRQSIGWLEAYGALQANGKKVHSQNWDIAVTETTNALNKALPLTKLNETEQKYLKELNNPEGWTLLKYADGFAYLEASTEKQFDSCGLYFPSQYLGAAAQWDHFLKDGILKELPPAQAPNSYQSGEKWLNLLKKSLSKKNGKNWYSLYHIGVIYCAMDDREQAKKYFEQSIALSPSPWSYACLAMLAEKDKKLDFAAEHIEKALKLQKDRHIALEALRIHNLAKKYSETVKLYQSLPSHIKALGRAKLHLIKASIQTNALKTAEKLLVKPFVIADIREGELSLSDLWFDLQAKKEAQRLNRTLSLEEQQAIRKSKLPTHLDYRMNNKES